jgi:phosphonate transport system substrate-binding protein
MVSVLVLFVLAACGGQSTPTPTVEPTAVPTEEATEQAATRAIILADISDDPAETVEVFQPLADYLGANLSEFGIGSGEVKAAPDLDTMADWLEAGEVDLYFDSLYPVMIMVDRAGAQPILRRWKDGVEKYHTVIFARADSGIESLEDLKGNLIGMEDNYSTSAFMLPLAYLADAGLKGSEKSDTSATVGDDEVGYVFSGDDENTIQWVLSNRVVAGAVNSEAYADIPEESREGLVVLTETEEVPRHVAVVPGDMDADMVEAISALLVGLDETDEGKEILTIFEETAKFDEFPEGKENALNRARELFELVEAGSS